VGLLGGPFWKEERDEKPVNSKNTLWKSNGQQVWIRSSTESRDFFLKKTKRDKRFSSEGVTQLSLKTEEEGEGRGGVGETSARSRRWGKESGLINEGVMEKLAGVTEATNQGRG